MGEFKLHGIVDKTGIENSAMAALGVLKAAYDRAEQIERNPWEFAVEIGDLLAAGINHASLRWLLSQGFVSHAEEVFNSAAPVRSFRPLANLCLPDRACFVLTRDGLHMANQLLATLSGNETTDDAPRWDSQRRELSWAGVVLKRFRSRAENQGLILSAFEEEGWPGRVDDPLPPVASSDGSSRLRDAIRRLNEGHSLPVVRFAGDGTGTGICWHHSAPHTHRRSTSKCMASISATNGALDIPKDEPTGGVVIGAST